MTEFLDQLRHRVRNALDELERARDTGDDYSIQVHTGELESIAQIAESHGVALRELDGFGPA
jgi:hypothetical protein